MYNIFQKKIYIKHYNIICVSHGKLTTLHIMNLPSIVNPSVHKLTAHHPMGRG